LYDKQEHISGKEGTDMEIRPSALPEVRLQDKPAGAAQTDTQKPVVGDQVTIGGNQGETPAPKKWTFLHYGAGDNNLSRYIYGDADEMESIGSDANTNLVTQLDQSSGNCKRIYLVKDDVKGTITSPPLEDMGPSVDMSNPQTLTDFIVWGVKNFPGQYLGLSIGDHGGGTAGAITDDRDGKGIMTPQNLQKALQDAEAITGKKIDVLGFDCCLMANTEVAYQLKDSVSYMVASEESEGGLGWPYNFVLKEEVLERLQEELKTRINVDPKEFAQKIVADTATVQGDLPTMSTIDMSKMQDVAQKMDGFAGAVLETKTPMSDLKSLVSKTQSFSGFKDIYDFCDKVINQPSIQDEKLKAAAKDVLTSLDSAIIANQHSERYPNAHGLQIELKTYGGPSGSYKELAFAKDTRWGEAMAKIAGKGPEGEAPVGGGFDDGSFGFYE
jgi:hypothetical protein